MFSISCCVELIVEGPKSEQNKRFIQTIMDAEKSSYDKCPALPEESFSLLLLLRSDLRFLGGSNLAGSKLDLFSPALNLLSDSVLDLSLFLLPRLFESSVSLSKLGLLLPNLDLISLLDLVLFLA